MVAESIGWLLVDEAGQATPQAALGGIWRAKRAVIIGDPLQLEPILTLPNKAVEAIRKVFGAPTGYHPVSSSTQRLADKATRYGAEFLQSNGNSLWVGCPLRVHRRCYWEMFENSIAYSDEMVWKTKVDKHWTTELGDTRWIDCRGARAQEHYFEEEGRIALHLLLRCRQEAATQGKEASLFVITPFRSVLERFKDLASSVGKLEQEWLENVTGTIHTFQGKEAEFVVILLGGDPSRQGAFDWASEHPNLLNVALTRAKKRAYVVANRQLWRRCAFFSALAERFTYETGRPDRVEWRRMEYRRAD